MVLCGDEMIGEGKRGRNNVPVLRTEINALGEKVRADRWDVIQGHLLEPEAGNEENGSNEVLTLGHVIDTEKGECCGRKVVSRDSPSRPPIEHKPNMTELYWKWPKSISSRAGWVRRITMVRFFPPGP